MSDPTLAKDAVNRLLDELALTHIASRTACEAYTGRLAWWGLVRRWSKRCGLNVAGAVSCRHCGTVTAVCLDHGIWAEQRGPIVCSACSGVAVGLMRFTLAGGA